MRHDQLLLLQAVLHRLQKQQLSGLFTSSQKSSSIQHLLQSIRQRLKADKPKADMLMILAVGKLGTMAHLLLTLCLMLFQAVHVMYSAVSN